MTPRKVDGVLELLEREEDEDCCGLQTRPCGHPSLEHEQGALGLERGPDDCESGLEVDEPKE